MLYASATVKRACPTPQTRLQAGAGGQSEASP